MRTGGRGGALSSLLRGSFRARPRTAVAGDVRDVAERERLATGAADHADPARPVLMLTRTAKPVVPPRVLHVARILVDELENAERRARPLGSFSCADGTPK